jgi:hypothetical protein
MKSIFAAIGTVLRAAFTLVRSLISISGRLVAGLLGGSAAPPPAGDSPLVESLREEYQAQNEVSGKNTENIAAIVSAWCADSMIAGRPLPPPLPPRVTRAVANWLPGLTREECAELVCAGEDVVCEHIAGICSIAGVRPVQRLEALPAWAPATPIFDESLGFATIERELQDARSEI